MSTGVYLLFVALVATVVLAGRGITESSLILVAVISALMAMPWYLGARSRTAKPSKTENAAGAAWLWFRRLVCLFGAAMFFAASLSVVWMRGSPGMPAPWWLGAPIMASVGAFLVYFGIFGEGTDRYAGRDDARGAEPQSVAATAILAAKHSISRWAIAYLCSPPVAIALVLLISQVSMGAELLAWSRLPGETSELALFTWGLLPIQVFYLARLSRLHAVSEAQGAIAAHNLRSGTWRTFKPLRFAGFFGLFFLLLVFGLMRIQGTSPASFHSISGAAQYMFENWLCIHAMLLGCAMSLIYFSLARFHDSNSTTDA